MPLRGHVEKKTGTSCARMAPHLQHPSHPIYASSALCPLPNLTLLPLQASSAICPLPKLRSPTASSLLHCFQLRPLTAPSLLRYLPASQTPLSHRSKFPPLFARFPTPLSHRSKSPPLFARLPSSALSPLQVSSAICPLTQLASPTPLLARFTGHVHSLAPHFPRSRPQLRSIIPQLRPAVERRTQLQRAYMT